MVIDYIQQSAVRVGQWWPGSALQWEDQSDNWQPISSWRVRSRGAEGRRWACSSVPNHKQLGGQMSAVPNSHVGRPWSSQLNDLNNVFLFGIIRIEQVVVE